MRFFRHMRGEFLGLWYSRRIKLMFILGCTAVIIVFGSYAINNDWKSQVEAKLVSQGDFGVTGVFSLLCLEAGIWWGAVGWRQGTTIGTSAMTGSRLQLVGAKLLTLGLVGILGGLITQGVAILISTHWIDAFSKAPGNAIGVLLGGTALTGFCCCLIGTAAGILVRNQSIVLYALAIYFAIIETSLGVWNESYGFLLNSGIQAISGHRGDLPFEHGVVVLCVWTAVMTTVALIIFRRQTLLWQVDNSVLWSER